MYVVTGGTSGIGEALAQALAARKQSVLIIGRRSAELKRVAGDSGFIQYICADVSTSSGRVEIAQKLKKMPISALIHNAGIISPIKPILEINEDEWRLALATNLEAPLFLTKQLYTELVGGKVLHIGSGAAHFPIKAWATYCVSKAALNMLTRCWQAESKEVAFASVMPGIINTPMQEQIRNAKYMDQEKLDFFQRLYEKKQLLSVETVANFLSWLLLDVDSTTFSSKEWDIYDESHHSAWLKHPYCVPKLED